MAHLGGIHMELTEYDKKEWEFYQTYNGYKEYQHAFLNQKIIKSF